MSNRIELYINTIKYLKPSQMYYRLINRAKRELYRRGILKIQIPRELKIKNSYDYLIYDLDFSQKYLDRFCIQDILDDKFTFINITNQADLSKDWNNKELQHLWRYNLHYFEFLFKLAYEYCNCEDNKVFYDKFRYLVENWIDNNRFAYGDGWHAYTISLRISNWITVYQIFQDKIKLDINFEQKFRNSIYRQYKYLQSNTEKDVLGNHYFENIKALILGSVFFVDVKVKDKFKDELLKQLNEQILEDGMHFELSPMYHKIILEDLIKITYWLKEDLIYKQLIIYIQKMIDVTYSFENKFGKTPSFNDSTDGISKDYRTLLNVCEKYFNIEPKFKNSLDDSGFYIIANENMKMIFNTGDICPTYLPAHGHCDALSFELSISSKPILVNSGTYRYEYGEWRNYFRSTKAHNTVTISDKEQSQFWSSFRVAKRIYNIKRKQFHYKDILFYAGSYTSYSGDVHKRFVGYIDKNRIIVLDYVNSEREEVVNGYIHFLPETYLDVQGNIIYLINEETSIVITAIGTSKVEIEQGWYSEQFNLKEKNKVAVLKKDNKKAIFGYMIDFGDSKLIELENDLKIINDNEIIINYEELGDML